VQVCILLTVAHG